MPNPDNLQLPPEFGRWLQEAPFEALPDLWGDIERQYGDRGRAWLGRNDRYYLLVRLCGRRDAIHPWLYARSREVEKNPAGYLDLWAREHYKSTIITFAGAIQEIVRDPEVTIVIFSHTKPVARKFWRQIRDELEKNEDLKRVYSDVLWQDPRKDAPRWAEDSGLVVKRTKNPKEATLEAHGLVDGQPTGGHWTLRIYDDVVVPESVTTPEMVAKTTSAWELSDNLGARLEDGNAGPAWHVGTRYSFADTYHDIMSRCALKPRIHPATDNGRPDGKPVLLTEALWAQKKINQGPATIACQMLQNPAAGKQASFDKAWLSFQEVRPATLNVYIMVDPANSRKKESDNTAIAVVGVDVAMNFWLLDGARHKMGLQQRWLALRNMRRKWLRMPGVQLVKVGYERYGMQSDMDFFELEMQKPGEEHFPIEELAWVYNDTSGQSKKDRVERLQPLFLQGKFHLAAVCKRKMPARGSNGAELLDAQGNVLMVLEDFVTKRQQEVIDAGQPFRVFSPVNCRDEDGNLYSLNKGFLDEYLYFPFSSKKDLIDAISRIFDMDPVPPVIVDEKMLEPEVFADGL